MPTIDAQCELQAAAERIWELIQDFGNIEAWWPQGGPVRIARVDVEGQGPGMVRHIYNEGMPAPVSERLDSLDPPSRLWQLSIVGERPAGLLRYQATGRLQPLDAQRCTISYHGQFEVEPGREDEARQFLEGCYALMFAGLEEAARRG